MAEPKSVLDIDTWAELAEEVQIRCKNFPHYTKSIVDGYIDFDSFINMSFEAIKTAIVSEEGDPKIRPGHLPKIERLYKEARTAAYDAMDVRMDAGTREIITSEREIATSKQSAGSLETFLDKSSPGTQASSLNLAIVDGVALPIALVVETSQEKKKRVDRELKKETLTALDLFQNLGRAGPELGPILVRTGWQD